MLFTAALVTAGCYCPVEQPSAEPRRLISLGLGQALTADQVKQMHDDLMREQLGDIGRAAEIDPSVTDWRDQLQSGIQDVVICQPMTYWSRDVNGRPIRLTGMLFLPRRWIPSPLPYYLPLIAYSHATELQRDQVPSEFGGYEWMVGAAAALFFNFAVVMPDLPGLGGADPASYHPYCQASSLAYSMADMIQAAQDAFHGELCGQYIWNGQLYVLGYSEGAYAAMATVKELQVHAAQYPGLTVTGSACMGGPFDLSGIMRQIMVDSDQPYSEPLFVAYTALAYNAVYGEVFDPNQVLNPQLLPDIIEWMNGSNSFGTVNRLVAERLGLPDGGHPLPRELLNPDWVRRNLADDVYTTTPAGQFLIENDLWSGWAPDSPMLLRASPDDDLVPYANSEKAFNAFTALGAGQHLKFSPIGKPGDGITHAQGGILSVPSAIIWFRQGCPKG